MRSTTIRQLATAFISTAAICTAAPVPLAVAVPADAPGIGQHAPRLDGQPAPVDESTADAHMMPDSRDRATGYQPELAPDSAPVTPPLAATSSGFDLVSAAIGLTAGAGLLIALMAFGPGLWGVGLGGHGRARA